MLTLFSFIFTIIGGINWLLIGMLQYDFIAGFFGFQSSIFSRLIYILFGISACYVVIRVIANKGNFKIFERKKQKSDQKSEKNPETSQSENVFEEELEKQNHNT